MQKNKTLLLKTNLDDHKTASKSYLYILSRFLNIKNILIKALVFTEGKLISDFKKEDDLFNFHFAAQGAVVNNTSTLLDFQIRTKHQLNGFTINEEDILSIIKNINPNKAYGCYNISIRMIQFCGGSFTVSLNLLFKPMLEEGVFSEHW